MNPVTLRSNAKINLTLEIVGKREDGYHEIDTVMQAVSVYDTVRLEKIPDGIGIAVNLPYVPRDRRNTAYKAAELFFAETGVHGGVFIAIEKNIPVSAGLAGGSSNAAAVLKGLNWIYGTGLSAERLCGMGAKIGADVPFCLIGGTARGTGIGERLERCPDMPQCHIIIAKPEVSVSTPEAYGAWDRLNSGRATYANGTIAGGIGEALEKSDIVMLARGLHNDLEYVTEPKVASVTDIKRTMRSCGALNAQMSGSGPSVFGIFTNVYKAKAAYAALKKKHKEVFLCKPVGVGNRV